MHEPIGPPTKIEAQLLGGELYFKATDVVALLRDRAKECAKAAAEEEAEAGDDHGSEAFFSAVAYRVMASDYEQRADWVDVAVMEALST